MIPHRDPRSVHVRELMPQKHLLTRNFRAYNAPFIDMIDDWIFGRTPDKDRFIPKDGIDRDTALDHLSRIVNTDRVAHDDKVASCSYLMTIWFEKK